jgi:hypothetical protein
MAGGRGNYEWLWFDPDRKQYRALIYVEGVRKRPKLMTRKEELSLIENGADDFECTLGSILEDLTLQREARSSV